MAIERSERVGVDRTRILFGNHAGINVDSFRARFQSKIVAENAIFLADFRLAKMARDPVARGGRDKRGKKVTPAPVNRVLECA